MIERYNIFYLEDNPEDRFLLLRETNNLGLSSLVVGSLEEMNSKLQTARAQVYLLDGKVPRRPTDGADLVVRESIECVRSNVPGASIVVYSTSENVKDIAEEMQIPFYDKNKTQYSVIATDLRRIVDELNISK